MSDLEAIRSHEETAEYFAGETPDHSGQRESWPTPARRQELVEATPAFLRMCGEFGHDMQPGISLQLKEGSAMIGNWHVCRTCGMTATIEIHDDLTKHVEGDATAQPCHHDDN